MNEQNVDAMETDLLIVWHDLGLCTDAWARCFGQGDYSDSVSLRLIAERLAARGVLVPSAADDDTLADVIGLSDDGRGFSFPWVLRDCLQRLAKGEPLPAKGYHHPSPEEIREIVGRINAPDE